MSAADPAVASPGPQRLASREFIAGREAAVFAGRVQLLYRLSGPGYAGTLINALVVVVALWPVASRGVLAGWLALMLAVTAGRYLLYRRFVARAPAADAIAPWRRRFVFGAVAAGSAWGLLGGWGVPADAMLYHALLVFVVGGMVASALVVLTPVRSAFYGFAAPALLPLVVVNFMQDDRVFLFVGAVLVVFAGVVVALVPTMHRAHVDPLRARYENDALVDRLSAANRELTGRIEAQRATEAELQRSNARLDALIDASPLAIVVQDRAGLVTRWNRAAERIFGWSALEVVGQKSPVVPGDKAVERLQFAERIARGEEFVEVETERQRKDGRRIVVSISAAPLRAADGAGEGRVILVADITGRKHAERLQLLEHTVTRVLSESREIDDAIREVLRTFCETAGWTYGGRWVIDGRAQKLDCLQTWHCGGAAVAMFADSNRSMQRAFHPQGGGLLRHVWESAEPAWIEDVAVDPLVTRREAAANAGLHAALAFPVLILGKLYGVMEFMASEPRPRDEGLIRVARSIGSQIGQFIARREAELNLTFFANHDTLTGLPNRAMFGERLSQGLARAHRNGRMLGVLFVDLDRFKVINDTLGHDAGDRLLQQVASRLRGCLREGDTIARQGGDEFVVLLEDMTEATQAADVAQKIIETVARPFQLAGQEYHVTASVGISLCPDDGVEVQSLLKNADIAMYRAKETGKNNFQFYSAQANRHSLERLAFENDLRHALERGELRLFYQPKFDCVSGALRGAEALLRWFNPKRGPVAPAQLIAVAEETGLIVEIGDWVLQTACRDARDWAARGLPPIPVAVNLSARQFAREDLAEAVAGALARHGLAASRLELEITESAVMENADHAAAALERLHALGVRVALDDFGTGYSSLGYLKRFPVDSVKIDRSFIKDVPQDADDVAITRAVIAMAHGLDLTVVAEGVETAAQVAFLREHACDEMQGYLLAEPRDLAALEALLRAPARAFT